MYEKLKCIFNARSIAVVGASSVIGKTGNTVLKNIIDGGYKGDLYPVNPRSSEVLGIPCYASLEDIPTDIDLVVIIVPAKIVPETMEQAGRKHAKGAVIISGGFREIGNDALEKQVLDIAAHYGIRVLGPNCQGLNYTPNNMCATWPLITGKGPIAVVSQSGTIGAAMEMWATEDHIGISAFVALGNKSDIDELDLMEFFTQDPNTGVIALNIEGIKDGQRFIACATQATENKHLVVLKPGRTESGKKAAESHTKSIGGSDLVFDAVCKQFGIVRAYDLNAFYDYAKVAALAVPPQGKRVAVITSSGGSGILAVDAMEGTDLSLSVLSCETKQQLTEELPSQCVISNPLDLTGDATAERYSKALSKLAFDDSSDILLVIFGDPIPGARDVIASILEQGCKKTIIVAYLGGGEVEKAETIALHEIGIPVFPTPERAIAALQTIVNKN